MILSSRVPLLGLNKDLAQGGMCACPPESRACLYPVASNFRGGLLDLLGSLSGL